jgi:hypothetical protein
MNIDDLLVQLGIDYSGQDGYVVFWYHHYSGIRKFMFGRIKLFRSYLPLEAFDDTDRV